jgi:CRISPR-associated protein Csm4
MVTTGASAARQLLTTSPGKGASAVEHWLVRLRFRGPAHFGVEGIGQERTASWVHSDTLWGALIAIWYRYGLDRRWGDLGARLLGAGQSRAPFALSSAFPFSAADLYLPKPLGISNVGLQGEEKLAKQISFLPLPLFASWLDGVRVAPEALKMAKLRLGEAVQITLRARVVLDRVTHRAQIFHVAQVTFARDAGLWCLVRLHDPTFREPLREAFEALGEEGLGGGRSTGTGGFRADWQPIDLQDASLPDRESWARLLRAGQTGDRYCLLSLCNPDPTERERILSGAIPAVLERKGWSQARDGRQTFRLPVRMLAEGSLLGADPTGRIVDVTPEALRPTLPHAIWRIGIALAVPVRQGEVSE